MPSEIFPLAKRLNQASEFDAVFNASDLRKSLPSFLFLAKHNHRGFNRLGMVVSKKNVPTAVARNRLKRNIRECFRRLPLLGQDGLDVVILARRGAGKLPNQGELVKQALTALHQQATDGKT